MKKSVGNEDPILIPTALAKPAAPRTAKVPPTPMAAPSGDGVIPSARPEPATSATPSTAVTAAATRQLLRRPSGDQLRTSKSALAAATQTSVGSAAAAARASRGPASATGG